MLRTMSSQVLNSSEDRPSTASLVQLLSLFDHLPIKMLFFMKMRFPVLLFLPIDSYLVVGYDPQKPGSFFTPSLPIFYTDYLDSP